MALSKTGICDFGWKARDFALKGVDGKTYTLAEVRGPKGTLVVFICNHCPYVKASIDRIVAEAKALREIGIGTIAIMPNDTATYREDSFDNMKAFAAKHGFTFPYVIDETQDVARAYDAQCTPDFFGFNVKDELQYRGRLDASRTTPVANARRDLFEAMKQVAETGHGPVEQTPSMGCSIKWTGRVMAAYAPQMLAVLFHSLQTPFGTEKFILTQASNDATYFGSARSCRRCRKAIDGLPGN
jgi:peroxiredoxin